MVSLVLLLCVLGAWLAWFFFASVPVYATSHEFQLTRGGNLLVTFPPETLARLLPGQKATLTLPPPNGPTYQAEVLNRPDQGQRAVEIYLFAPADAFAPQTPPSGVVKVEMETVSPATLLLRSAHTWMGN
jgi:hypothetical protein